MYKVSILPGAFKGRIDMTCHNINILSCALNSINNIPNYSAADVGRMVQKKF